VQNYFLRISISRAQQTCFLFLNINAYLGNWRSRYDARKALRLSQNPTSARVVLIEASGNLIPFQRTPAGSRRASCDASFDTKDNGA
jgi:hypothetical protein